MMSVVGVVGVVVVVVVVVVGGGGGEQLLYMGSPRAHVWSHRIQKTTPLLFEFEIIVRDQCVEERCFIFLF